MSKHQARRKIPQIRSKARTQPPSGPLTLADLIVAAYDTLGDTRAVARVLSSRPMGRRVGLQVVIE